MALKERQPRTKWHGRPIAIPLGFSMLPLRPDTAWLLGLLTGDGCIKSKGAITLAVSDTDSDVIGKVRSIVGGVSYIEKRHGCTVLYFCSVRLVQELKLLGIHPRKTYSLHWPQIETSLYPHFFRGLLDSDGCWVRNNRTLRFSYKSADPSFLYAMDDFLRSNNIVRDVRHVYCYPSRNPKWAASNAFIAAGYDSRVLGTWMYGDGCTDANRSARKHGIWKLFMTNARPFVWPLPSSRSRRPS